MISKQAQVRTMNWRDLAKYFIHGAAFSVLFLVLSVAWIFVFAFLTVVGSIIGIIIGIAVLFLFIGYANRSITGFLWFPVKMSFWSTLLHGFVLFLILLPIHVGMIVANAILATMSSTTFPDIATT